MNHRLSLVLEALEQSNSGFRFRVTARNDSAVKLFLPFPEITSLAFTSVATGREAEWYTRLLVSASGRGFTLQPEESQVFEWQVRPCSFEPPLPVEGDYSDWNYRRWCVGIEAGTYSVQCQWNVDAGFFDPDSHMRIGDLERAATAEDAQFWMGRIESNVVQVEYASPSP